MRAEAIQRREERGRGHRAMGRQEFKEGKRDSFFGRFVYEQVVPKDHFLVKLNENEAVPWQRFRYKLVNYHQMPSRRIPPPIVQV